MKIIIMNEKLVPMENAASVLRKVSTRRWLR